MMMILILVVIVIVIITIMIMIIMIVITIIILRIHPAISRYISNIPLHLDKSRCLVVQSVSRNCFRWVFREVDGERQAEVTVCHLGYLGSVLQLPWWFPARKRMRMFGLMHTLGKQTRAKGIVFCLDAGS